MTILTDAEIIDIRDAMLPGQGEALDLVAFAHAVLARAMPVQPTPGLLMSMAIRYDHGLGVPGYYDQAATLANVLLASGHATQGLHGRVDTTRVTHAQRLSATLTTMRQLYEEVSGHGFYRPEREAYYCQMQTAMLSPAGNAGNTAGAQAAESGASVLIAGNSDGSRPDA